MLRVKEAQKYFLTLHFGPKTLLNNILNWRGCVPHAHLFYTTSYATVQTTDLKKKFLMEFLRLVVQTDLSGPGNRGVVVPVEQGAKVKDFPI